MDLLFWLLRRLLPLGLVAGTGFLMFSSFTPAASDRVEGFGIDASVISAPASDLAASLSGIPSEPPLLVRVSFDWSQLEPARDVYDWSAGGLDLQLASLSTQGRKIIGVLEGGPVYLVSSINLPVDQTQLLLRWAAFVQAVVERYGDQIDTWEIGSQINTTRGVSPFLYPMDEHAAVNPDPTLYARLVKTANAVIKNTDPNDEVWTGSLVGSTSAACNLNPLTFLLELNSAKAWGSLDGITFEPDRGAVTPETHAAINPRCASSLPESDSTLSGETRAVQELIRQLGGKSIRVSGLGWSEDLLASASPTRSITQGQLQADLITRASVPLLALNSVPSVLWRFDPVAAPETVLALANLHDLLVGAKPLGQVQGDGGTVNEYRFRKGNQLIILVWRSIDGDTAAPVSLANLEAKSLSAFPVDAASLSDAYATPITADETGSALILVNERPVILIGSNADWSVGIQQDAQNWVELGQNQVKQGLRRLANAQKAALKNWIAGLFDSAKDQAVTWGEEKLDELLN